MFLSLFNAIALDKQLDWCTEAYNCDVVILVCFSC